MRYSASAFLPGDDDTARLGKFLASRLAVGDTVLLHGPIGAGKTSLARAIIQSKLSTAGRNEDVPSPTYTLVQTYLDGQSEIWHADLYRLTDISEVLELGLEDAFGSAIVLVEWPDRLGEFEPEDALHVRFAFEGDGRKVIMSGNSERWSDIADWLADA